MKNYVLKDYNVLESFIQDKKLTHLCHASQGSGMLYYDDNVKVSMGYLYNIYHIFPSFGIYITFHTKLKIYYNKNHGFFVKCEDKRYYINSLKENFKEEFDEIQNS